MSACLWLMWFENWLPKHPTKPDPNPTPLSVPKIFQSTKTLHLGNTLCRESAPSLATSNEIPRRSLAIGLLVLSQPLHTRRIIVDHFQTSAMARMFTGASNVCVNGGTFNVTNNHSDEKLLMTNMGAYSLTSPSWGTSEAPLEHQHWRI